MERPIIGMLHLPPFLADVDVKHSSPLGDVSLANEVEDLIQRGLADAVIVSGSSTGCAASIEQVRQVKQAAGDGPVYVGSGVTPESIEALWKDGQADGFIVGSSLKRDGLASQPVDVARVKALVTAFDQCAS